MSNICQCLSIYFESIHILGISSSVPTIAIAVAIEILYMCIYIYIYVNIYICKLKRKISNMLYPIWKYRGRGAGGLGENPWWVYFHIGYRILDRY